MNRTLFFTLLLGLVGCQQAPAELSEEWLVKYRPGASMVKDGQPLAGEIQLVSLNTSEAQELRADPGVVFVQPNYVYEAQRLPNDSYFQMQWHLRAIGMPKAWDSTVGSPQAVIAVIDTGITNHPDLKGRTLPGYDFASRADTGDGDGWDPDPSDPGDTNGSSHGTLVTGVIGAASNNRLGVTGVCWQCSLLPVRALNRQRQSTSADLVAAVRWAAGLEVVGAPPNPNPARVINMSLGSRITGGCSADPAMAGAIAEATAAGALVVVAAGNSATQAAEFSPASCPGALSVTATDRWGRLTNYANFGPAVGLAAPGGMLYQDLDGDGKSDGILTTAYSLGEGFGYYFYQGTSLATPQVAGVAGLVASLRPDWSPEQIANALLGSAVPIPKSYCPGGCGAGALNAPGAIQLAEATN